MKWKSVMAGVIGSMMGAMFGGCSAFQTMPEGKLLKLEYRRSTMRSERQYEVKLTTEANGDVMLRAKKEPYGPLLQKKLTAEEVDGFVRIITEEKMYKYKEMYKPIFRVLDGYMWHFSAVFEQGKIYSSGDNATPSGEGLEKICEYAASLVCDSIP